MLLSPVQLARLDGSLRPMVARIGCEIASIGFDMTALLAWKTFYQFCLCDTGTAKSKSDVAWEDEEKS